MTASQQHPAVDGFIRKQQPWQAHLAALRTMLLAAPLVETIKWRTPCYTFNEQNVVLLGTLKDCCTLSFMKGALLKDPDKLLIMPGQNTRSARYLRFTTLEEITARAAVIEAYVREAIELEKAGVKFDYKADAQLPLPAELEKKFLDNPALKTAFFNLTPGRQRAYLLHFSSAKQSATRTARIDKHTPNILAGKGPDDDYKQRQR